MPVPTNTTGNGSPSTSSQSGPSTSTGNAQPEATANQPSKGQKSMTKAERRELQERQRAAKAQQKQAGSAPNTGKPKGASGSQSGAQNNPPSMQRRSTGGPNNASASGANALGGEEATGKVQRGLRIFSHFGLTKQVSTTQIRAEAVLHPAIVRLGLQFSEFKIMGANARCIATLSAFKTVIQDYVTPPNNTLSRHLMTYLSPHITHLVTARPMSVTMGNAIRQLKLEISSSDIDLPEQDAKDELCEKIDNYIRDRIIIADEVIEETAGKKIKSGDVILAYARSSVVEKVLLRAHEDGKKFSVIVVDSRPMLEGKSLLRRLTSLDPPIPCTYALLPALPALIPSSNVSLALLGAHAIYSNGAVYSRAGTALVAMLCKKVEVPVVVCAETYKFAEGVALDGFTKNELAPIQPNSTTKPKPSLEILNPLYDLTPPSSVTAVVTEVGIIPPSSVSSIPLALGRTVV